MSSENSPTSSTEVDPLAYTGRLFGGLKSDLARKRQFYWSDFTDGLNTKVLGSVSFLFFCHKASKLVKTHICQNPKILIILEIKLT